MWRVFILFPVLFSSCYIRQPITNSVSVQSKTFATDSVKGITVILENDEEVFSWSISVKDTAGNMLAVKRPDHHPGFLKDTAVTTPVPDFVHFDSLPDSIPLHICFEKYGYFPFDTLIFFTSALQLTIRAVENPQQQWGCDFDPESQYHYGADRLSPLNRTFSRGQIVRQPAPR
ncbi:MAG: hypothetical protein MUC87_18900 [Bacteroidia bacterium]|jgi:hypothetical protein|nr:hypothetical protein [Bacteroidia bacterium]